MHIVKVSKKTGLSLDRITNFTVLATATSSTRATQEGHLTLCNDGAGRAAAYFEGAPGAGIACVGAGKICQYLCNLACANRLASILQYSQQRGFEIGEL
jgi:hypothetical protein